MKKADLIIGKWYTCPGWMETKAIKILRNTSGSSDVVQISERILKDGTYSKYTKNWSDTYTKFEEVPISEIAQYLPKDHPDLQNIIPQYVRCIKQNRFNKHYPESEVGKVFKVLESCAKGYRLLESTETYVNKSRFTLSSKEEYDAQFKTNPLTLEESYPVCEDCQGIGRVIEAKLYPSGHTEVWETCPNCNGEGFLEDTGLKEFPRTGFVIGHPEELIKYLKTVKKQSSNTGSGHASIMWNNSHWWFSITTKNSNKDLYTVEQLNKFINPKIKQNEVPRIKTEVRRTIITGTVAICHRGQQGAIGSRPEGNKASTRTGRTLVIRTEKCGKIGFRSDS